MPIFEYRCAACGHEFETLVTGARQPHCPKCDGRDLAKQLSVFAVSTGGRPSAVESSGPCGSCGDPRGPGACSLN